MKITQTIIKEITDIYLQKNLNLKKLNKLKKEGKEKILKPTNFYEPL